MSSSGYGGAPLWTDFGRDDPPRSHDPHVQPEGGRSGSAVVGEDERPLAGRIAVGAEVGRVEELGRGFAVVVGEGRAGDRGVVFHRLAADHDRVAGLPAGGLGGGVGSPGSGSGAGAANMAADAVANARRAMTVGGRVEAVLGNDRVVTIVSCGKRISWNAGSHGMQVSSECAVSWDARSRGMRGLVGCAAPCAKISCAELPATARTHPWKPGLSGETGPIRACGCPGFCRGNCRGALCRRTAGPPAGSGPVVASRWPYPACRGPVPAWRAARALRCPQIA